MTKFYAYIALGGEDKLSIFEMASNDGALHLMRDVPLGGAPGPLAVDPEQRNLYVGLRSTNEIVSFRIDSSSGDLAPFGRAVTLDADPCYLSTDRQGRFLLSSYYGAGKVMVHAIGSDGQVSQEPVVSLATAERAHCIQTDSSNKYVFVPHTAGPNLIFQFKFDEQTGQLIPNEVPTVVPKAGEGPRHYVFHPAKDIVYFSNEQGCSVTAYRFDRQNGTLSPVQTLSTLPDDFRGENTCAQIHIHPNGRFLYVSNRGHNSIACFAIHGPSGQLTSLGQQPTEPIPRVFGLDPGGRYLYAAGQGSGQLAAYQVNPETGSLSHLNTYAVGERPMWVMVLELPGV